jgi:two-component sensor histidine kinase
LIAQVVAPYGQSRFNLDSESIFVSEKSVVPIALVLNELATNAVKYGSLSQRDGKVDIHCQGNGDKVQIKWVEQGGPQVTQDQRKGFGRQLLERTIAGQRAEL